MPFQKGNTLAKNKRGTKNLLPEIRERVLKAVNKRLTLDNILSKVDDTDLLKLAVSLMPKDIALKVTSDVTYISSTPRPSDTLQNTKLLEISESINTIDTKSSVNNINTQDYITVESTESIHNDKTNNNIIINDTINNNINNNNTNIPNEQGPRPDAQLIDNIINTASEDTDE